jgi:poly(A) polymerase
MDGQKKTQWGITSAISEAPPKPEENRLNDELIATLTRKNVFESPEGNTKRQGRHSLWRKIA